MTLEFTTAAKRKKPLFFMLDGEKFTFNRPKDAVFVMGVHDGQDEVTVLFEWLEKGLGEEQTRKIEARLRDPEDEFDISDLRQIVKKLLGEVSGRPTG